MRYLYHLVILCLCISCNSTDKSSLKQEVVPVTTEKTDTIPSTATAITWDSFLVVGSGTVWREEEKEGSGDWIKVHVVNIGGFKSEPNIGDVVQVIPLTAALAPVALKITKTTPRDDLGEGSPQWYEVELETVEDKRYFEFEASKERRGESPVDVAIVYAADLNCTYVGTEGMESVTLPQDITLDLVKGAIDFDGDGLPEVLLCEFCCKDKTKATSCDYTCSTTYLKYDGLWRVIDATQPM